MKVIVNEAGFYGGTWYDAGPKEQEMAEKVAKPFLPPFGAQLSRQADKKPVAPASGGGKPGEKTPD